MSLQWSDEGFVLGLRQHGETGALLEVFTAQNGRAGGYVYGGASRRRRPDFEIANKLALTWQARVGDQLGRFAQVELIEANAARVLADPAALAAMSAAIALVRTAAPERQAFPALFEALNVLIHAADAPDLLPALYARFELGLLAALGYGLDLEACALTGATENLAFVSPKTGRAACAQAGAPYADKLLRLPPFLVDPNAALEEGDVADALALAGHFLDLRVFDAKGEGLPPARRRLIEHLGHAGRL